MLLVLPVVLLLICFLWEKMVFALIRYCPAGFSLPCVSQPLLAVSSLLLPAFFVLPLPFEGRRRAAQVKSRSRSNEILKLR